MDFSEGTGMPHHYMYHDHTTPARDSIDSQDSTPTRHGESRPAPATRRGVFGQYGRRVIVQSDGRKGSYRCHLDSWLDEVMGIKGIPIPYGWHNTSPHVERFIRTLREKALDHFIFLGIGHIRCVLCEYIRYYNRARPSQAIHGIPEPHPELKKPPPRFAKLLALPILGGIHHDHRLAA
jgi:hypothetical protein